MTLSVIIPVYKAEQTLDRCVESVLMQDVDMMEVILIDDGSPDRCPEMCEEWARKDNRIRVIHKKNGGPGIARNRGMDMAKGEYITFVDSDDYLLPDTYGYLIERMKADNLDMIEYALSQQDTKRPSLQLEEHVYDNHKDYWLMEKAWLHGYLCNKIFRREAIGKERCTDLRVGEDLLLFATVLGKCHKVATSSHGTYVYVANALGLSKRNTRQSISDMLHAEAMAAWKMKTMPWDKNGKNIYYYMCCRIYDLLRFNIKL